MVTQPRALRTSWKTLPCPVERDALHIPSTYTASEFEAMTAGLIPVQMEDKWFVFFEEPWLYFHRSWTGSCVFGVRLDPLPDGGVAVAEAWVSRDKEQYRGQDTGYEVQVLTFLIDALLLRKMVAFPVPASAAGTPEGLFQHAMIGAAYPERDFVPSPPVPTWWQRFRGRFR